VHVLGDDVCRLGVERATLVEQPPELGLVLRERPIAAADSVPARVDVHVEPDRQRLVEGVAYLRRGDGAAAEREHDRTLLVSAERGLAVLAEDLRDRLAGGSLDQVVGVDAADGARRRRLPRTHEADERDAPVQMRSRYARHAPTKSPSASPPNFSRVARASSHATAASATTASASTAETSLRSTSAVAASPVSRSTDARGFISVGSGFIAARATISSPFDIPPSIPPARFDVRRLSVSISSCASEPRSFASAKPSPISTPFTAWMPMRAAARRASRRSSLRAYEPRPGGTPLARTSTTPPSVSLSLRAASTASGSAPATGTASPRTRMPTVASSAFATAPAATWTAVCRADARSSASRPSASPYFCTPARSAWPGRGSVTDFVPFPCGSPSGAHGSIPHVQFLWSRLRTTSASGVPRVRPWRRPASTSTSSVSICWRGERPYPCCRRRRSASIASLSSTSPAGSPARIATSAGPCDSPAVARSSITPASLVRGA